LIARRTAPLDFEALKKLGVVLKRARYFLLCKGKMMDGTHFSQEDVLCSMMSKKMLQEYRISPFTLDGTRQLSFLEPPTLLKEEVQKCLTGEM